VDYSNPAPLISVRWSTTRKIDHHGVQTAEHVTDSHPAGV